MSFSGVFPFGRPSTERPPRRPANGAARAFVLGVYPSALHVQWRPPRWLVGEAGVSGRVGALAVDVEPEVFWDGEDADARVAAWKRAVRFRDGDEPGEWGSVTAFGNGTSGQRIRKDVLEPLGLDPAEVWFSDAVPWYFVKRAGARAKKREQGDAIDEDYAPLAARDGRVPAASIPTRPSTSTLIRYAIEERRDALRAEILESETPLLVTLGEEARQVVAGIADRIDGGPCEPLRATMVGYAKRGSLLVRERRVEWLALRHPGQRNKDWRKLHEAWIATLRPGA